jgi:hypothetical protein
MMAGGGGAHDRDNHLLNPALALYMKKNTHRGRRILLKGYARQFAPLLNVRMEWRWMNIMYMEASQFFQCSNLYTVLTADF